MDNFYSQQTRGSRIFECVLQFLSIRQQYFCAYLLLGGQCNTLSIFPLPEEETFVIKHSTDLLREDFVAPHRKYFVFRICLNRTSVISLCLHVMPVLRSSRASLNSNNEPNVERLLQHNFTTVPFYDLIELESRFSGLQSRRVVSVKPGCYCPVNVKPEGPGRREIHSPVTVWVEKGISLSLLLRTHGTKCCNLGVHEDDRRLVSDPAWYCIIVLHKFPTVT